MIFFLRKGVFAVIGLFIRFDGFAQESYASWTDSVLILDNSVVQRRIQLPGPKGPLDTLFYKLSSGTFDYFEKTSPDFQFEMNNKTYSGADFWILSGIHPIEGAKQG